MLLIKPSVDWGFEHAPKLKHARREKPRMQRARQSLHNKKLRKLRQYIGLF